MCQDCVCLCARVPRRRQTLAALSELTGPSPLPPLVAQEEEGQQERRKDRKKKEGKQKGGREGEREINGHCGSSTICTMCHLLCTYTYIKYHDLFA